MPNPDPALHPGRWDGVVVLLSGASTMGKSYFAKTLLGPEYGACFLRLDRIYTKAVTEAGMLNAAKFNEVKDQQREARRLARDREWPRPAAKDAFFKAYERRVRAMFEKAKDEKAPLVLEGGSLTKDDEIAVVVRCADGVFGKAARIARVTVQVPYERWLQNRVARMAKTKLETARVRALTEDTYKREAANAVPPPHARIDDHIVGSPDDLRRLMETLSRVPAVGR